VPYRVRWNGQRRYERVEPLARILRLRIARGDSAYELAEAAGVFAGSVLTWKPGAGRQDH
jgi:hypothetical protein